MFDLKELLQTTSEFMDRNASKILQSEDFLVLSSDALVKLISRNSFCSDEMNIFKGMVNSLLLAIMNNKGSINKCLFVGSEINSDENVNQVQAYLNSFEYDARFGTCFIGICIAAWIKGNVFWE